MEKSRDDIESEISKIRSDIVSLGKTVANVGKTTAAGAQDMAYEKSKEMMVSSEKALSELQEQLNSLTNKLERKVRAKPIQALAIAAGIGFLISLLARR